MPPTCTPSRARDVACNQGTCPGLELNLGPFSPRAAALSTSHTGQGENVDFILQPGWLLLQFFCWGGAGTGPLSPEIPGFSYSKPKTETPIPKKVSFQVMGTMQLAASLCRVLINLFFSEYTFFQVQLIISGGAGGGRQLDPVTVQLITA